MPEHVTGLFNQQQAFTAYLRDPAVAPLPLQWAPRRAALYQRLVFNNLLGMLSSAFPVSTQLLGAFAWTGLIQRYISTHQSQTPLFTELAAEFVQWLQAQPALPHPALDELAHYEWVETALYQLPAEPLATFATGELLQVPLQLSPLAWPLLYRWPVHRLGSADAPDAPADLPTALLAHRDADGHVRFSELGMLAVQLLHAIDQEPGQTAPALLQQLAQRNGLQHTALDQDGAELLERFRHQGIVGRARSVPCQPPFPTGQPS